MKIHSLEYYDEADQWKLEKVNFFPDINLLVGVSGAGKTRIIKAIENLKKIAHGSFLNGVEWSIDFSTKDNLKYHWGGKFETKEKIIIRRDINGIPITELELNTEINLYEKKLNEEENCKILHEELKCNETTIVKRTYKDGIIFNGVKTPKLSPFQSVIHLLEQEDSVTPVKKELGKIILLPDSVVNFSDRTRFLPSVFKYYEKSSFLELRNSQEGILVKLAILFRYFPQELEKINKVFASIFNNVLELKIEISKVEESEFDDERLRSLLKVFPLNDVTIVIKEKGVPNSIRLKNLSAGMFKTLMYISELYLSPDDRVILIDEFENSLGVNYMDSVTDLITEARNLQFIITSHHPYIINNISPQYWRIVTRQGNIVTVKNAEDFHISKSRQKAFIDLINVLEEDDEEESED